MWDSKPSSEHGFTLLEILIAVTIMAFMTMAVVAITDQAFITKDRTTELNKNNLQVETAMSRFEWDFSQIYSPMYFSTVMSLGNNQQAPGANGGFDQFGNPLPQGGVPQQGGTPAPAAQAITPEQQMYFERLVQRFERNEHFSAVSKEGLPIPRFYAPERNVFEFFTSSNRRKLENSKESHFAWVRYALADRPANAPAPAEDNPAVPKSLKNLVRYYSAEDPYDDKRLNPEDEKTVKAAVLLENVESLDFQYWDYQRKKWETSLRTIQNGESIIRGVKLTIVWYDSQGIKRTNMRIFRNLWPMVIQADPATVAQPGAVGGTGTTAGNSDGTNNSSNTNGNGN